MAIARKAAWSAADSLLEAQTLDLDVQDLEDAPVIGRRHRRKDHIHEMLQA